MVIPDKRFLSIALTLSFLAASMTAHAGASFEATDIKAGARPLYGLVFGDYGSQYNHAPGGLVYARGLYRLNISDKLMLVPEFCWGILYLGHKSEHGRELFLFPFALNLYFDAPALNFNTNAGTFALRPYIGLGMYLNHYRSPRTQATGGDLGYQAGINLEYRHKKMKGAYVEVSIDHMFATNFKRYLPVLAFSAGAGYAFEYHGRSQTRE
jgi:hypothetical protein